jgi:hypothetical protein
LWKSEEKVLKNLKMAYPEDKKRMKVHSPAEKAEHHYYLKIYRCGMWLLFFNQSLETF